MTDTPSDHPMADALHLAEEAVLRRALLALDVDNRTQEVGLGKLDIRKRQQDIVFEPWKFAVSAFLAGAAVATAVALILGHHS